MDKNVAKNGFFLIEFLVYFALFTLISWLLVQLVAQSALTLRTSGKYNTTMVKDMSAFILLKKELQKFPIERTAWKVIEKHALIWNNGIQDMGFDFNAQKKTLTRISGSYNTATHTWHNYRKNILFSNVNAFLFELNSSFNPLKQEFITSIAYKISLEQDYGHASLQNFIVTQNRRLI